MVTVTNGDCIVEMDKYSNETFDLIVADPPFNIGYSYDRYDDKISKEKYLLWSKKWVDLCSALLKRNGSMYVCIGDERVAEIKMLLDCANLTMRNWIVWHYTFGPHMKNKFGRNHAHILYYVKNEADFTFNADAIRVPSVRQKIGDKRANKSGRVPGDVWTYSRVCGTFKERTDHPCQMPQALIERIILASSNHGDLVLDPFAGSGTTLAASEKHGRNSIGIEMSESYCQIIRDRLNVVVPI